MKSILLAVAFLGGCTSPDKPAPPSDKDRSGDIGGTLVITVGADLDAPVPMLTATVIGAQVGDQLFERLAEPGDNLNTVGDVGFRGVLAERWRWSGDSLSIAFELNPRARWQDGKPVTSRDVRFTFDLYRDPATASPVAPLLTTIDSVTVSDSLSATFWFSKRYPEQFFDATYQMRVMPQHLLGSLKRSDIKTSDFMRKPVGSGPFRFRRWEPGALVEIVADSAYYGGRPNLDRIIWTIAPDYTASLTKLFAGEADFHELLSAESMPEIARIQTLTVMRYPSLDHVFMSFQLRDPKNGRRPHPIFGDVNVRRALSMAVDRASLVKNVLDSLGQVSLGPITRAQPMTDTTLISIPYNLDSATRVLDSLGWRDTDGDGFREKNGRPLRFSIATPTSSKNRIRMAVLLQEMFKQAGARVDVEQLELNAFIERTSSRRFDAAMLGWHVDPSASSVRQTWSTSSSRARDGLNFGSYQSAKFDALVDSAGAEMDLVRAKQYYRLAYETIIDDAPAIWLYETVMMAGIHRRLRPTGVRADAWWAGLPRWSIPASERIPRDNIGPTQGP